MATNIKNFLVKITLPSTQNDFWVAISFSNFYVTWSHFVTKLVSYLQGTHKVIIMWKLSFYTSQCDAPVDMKGRP